MRSRRQQSRIPCIIIFSALCFILLVSFRISQATQNVSGRHSLRVGRFSQHQCPLTPPKTPFVPATASGTFTWRNVAAKHPVLSYTSLPEGKPLQLPRIQHKFLRSSRKSRATQTQRKDAIRQTFLKSWNSYKLYAWGHDELSPISAGYKDTYGGWGATLVDNLDTLLIMGLQEEFEDAIAATANISFTPDGFTGREVNIFETVIRYLGGLISAYDLAGCGDERLLTKAVEVAELAYEAFDTPNRMPVARWRIRDYDEEQEPSRFGGLAEMASFSLEFTRLSMLTGDMKYFDAAERVRAVLDQEQNRTRLPGMFPENVDLLEEDLSRGKVFTLGANADSTFEYFAKTYQLLGGHGPNYRKLYEESMDIAAEKLIFKPKTHDGADILVAGDWHSQGDQSYLEARGQHLTSFAAGMFMLGGKLFGIERHVEIGRKLADGCAWIYEHMPSGIMAESFIMTACPSIDGPCEYDPLRAVFTGFRDVRYLLRPEAVEAIFYAYRITGDSKYQDIAWNMFETINNKTSTELGNAELDDVTKIDPQKVDNMQSFWMAETLKYFYLIFADSDVLSLDDWVFNTEAHPLRVPQSWQKKVSKVVELNVELDL